MSRAQRIHAPSAGFHITARTQLGERWFVDELRDEFSSIICEGVSTFRHALLAFVLMPNHFHLVIRQGDAPTAWMMQRIMQRIAFRVQRKFNLSGHVFGRRYWSNLCPTPAYLRRAIVYVHLNPCKAGLTATPEEYRWSSHGAFARDDAPWHGDFAVDDGLTLFARESMDRASTRASYAAFVAYTAERRRTGIPGDWLLPEGPNRLLIPPAPLGDEHYATTFSAISHDTFERPARASVRDAAIAHLRRIDPGCDLDMVRNGGRQKRICQIRKQLIVALVVNGHATTAIARCLRVSPSLVSHLKAETRRSLRTTGHS